MITDIVHKQFIVSEDVDHAWVQYCKFGIENGTLLKDDSETIYEAPDVLIKIEYSEKPDTLIEKYGNRDLIDLYTKKMFSREIIPVLNSTYGDMLFDNMGVDQVDWLIKNLERKPLSKSASIGLLSPTIFTQNRRIPCLTTFSAKIRNSKVDLYATFRSQNIYKSYANFAALFKLGKYVADRLRYSIGYLHCYVISPHIYQEDVQEIKKIILENGNKDFAF